jgi:hypothetical protein
MKHFRHDNTEGYSQVELDQLNHLLDAAIEAAEPIADDIRESHIKNLSDQVLADFDAAHLKN